MKAKSKGGTDLTSLVPKKKRVNEDVSKFKDPTADEMRSFLESSNKYADEFDREEAIYWFAMDFQDSFRTPNLNTAIKKSEYKPGPMVRGIEHTDSELAMWLYNDLVGKYAGDANAYGIYTIDLENMQVVAPSGSAIYDINDGESPMQVYRKLAGKKIPTEAKLVVQDGYGVKAFKK